MKEFERIFLQRENQDLIWDALFFSCRFHCPLTKKVGNKIAMKELVSWTVDALMQLCPPMPLKISVRDDYVKINMFLAIPNRNVLGAIDDAEPVNRQINLLYYFFPLLVHFIVCDLSVAQCVLRLSFDRLSQRGDSRSAEVLRHCCMLYESFFNGWKFSLPPLERHQWNNTYKSLPQDYMFCQMEYVCMQKWHSTTQGQRKVANSCFTKLYQMKSNKQECVQQRENLSICFKEIHKLLTSDKTCLTDSAFCMGLWIYGHTCSRLPQYWLLKNCWKHIRIEHTDFVPFIDPLHVSSAKANQTFMLPQIKSCLQLYKSMVCFPEHFDVRFDNWLYLFDHHTDPQCYHFFQKTVPHLHHITARIQDARESILETTICDDIAGTISEALGQLYESSQKGCSTLISHVEVKQVSTQEVLLKATEDCNYHNYKHVTQNGGNRVCVSIANCAKNKSLLYNDIDYSIKKVWPSMVTNVQDHVTLLTRHEPGNVCILISHAMLDLLQSMSTYDTVGCLEAKRKIKESPMSQESMKASLSGVDEVDASRKNNKLAKRHAKIPISRNPLTQNLDTTRKENLLWSPDYCFLEYMIEKCT
jgi:hypothetical protein